MSRTFTLLMLGTVNHPHVEHPSLAMNELGHRVVVGGDVEPSLPASVLPGEGIDVHEAPPAARRTVTGLVSHVRWIRRLLRVVRPDVVHAHWIPGFAFFAALAGASPLVATAWGSDVLRANRRQLAAGRYTMRRADLVMADSRALLARLEELGAPSDRTLVVNWGVDLDAFSPASDGRAGARARLGLEEGPTVFSPRSLFPVYNIPTIVEAFERVVGQRPDLRLVIKHMGSTGQDIGEVAHPERVSLIGHVPYERMADFYRAADVCVSIASSDSSPRSVWEAMACGTPLVISDLPWVHELIENERHALVVPIETAAVAEAIRRVLSEPSLAAALAANGRELVEHHRDRRTEMARLSSAYMALAGAGDRPLDGHARFAASAI